MAEKEESFTVLLRDINPDMVTAWSDQQAFGGKKFDHLIQVSCGDIFVGAPPADAIVSPANSFGFMDGGIDMVYSRHFGWQMQERLQELLQSEFNGELPVGQAVIIPAYPKDQDLTKLDISPDVNHGQPICYLISAPTMRIPTHINNTVNAYLAFRAILRAVKYHNKTHVENPIKTVLCPGLGTAVGRMAYLKCAVQMRTAYDAVMFGSVSAINSPDSLRDCCTEHVKLLRVGGSSGSQFSDNPLPGELFVPK